jgi:hypothetical protein
MDALVAAAGIISTIECNGPSTRVKTISLAPHARRSEDSYRGSWRCDLL